MFGLLLILGGTFFKEIGASIAKKEVQDRKESIYTMGFLSLLWGTLFFLAIAFFIRKAFLFSMASLPTFSVRAILEIAQAHVAILAIARADRSTFGFIRTGTIPLLLGVDLLLGYAIGLPQIFGIAGIVMALGVLFINHGIRLKGIGFVIFTTINAVATLSLYKYNITHFNSVEAEQGIMSGILLLYFFGMALFAAKENPIHFLKKPIFLTQSLSEGIGSVFMGFAFLFAPASIITTAKRALTVFWATVSGTVYFHERHFLLKMLSFAFIVGGLILLVL